ncbi:MAG TPA: sodium:solute symporter family protein [Verrucomicrobiae bacterium]|nr:sodium:solute symporter family protein [Verrucomicrobiae bacterium]
MHLWGLHVLDLAVVVLFLLALLFIGIHASRNVQGETDFYLSGRKLGRVLQFFLNFGNATDSTGAVQLSSEVYRQGIGGLWISFQTLFITPFFWFTQPWYRRARLVTMADLFVDRFDSRGLASAYAAFNILIALILLGLGNLTAFKVTSAMVVKPESAWTDQERAQVRLFNEYRALAAQKEAGTLPNAMAERFSMLDNMNKRGELHSFITYIRPLPFYIAYSTIVALYIVIGGLRAAAVTDALQGLLVLLMSTLLLPLGLHRVGGFAGLHQLVPAYKFQLVGTVAMSDYTWYTIFAITFASLVQIFGLMHNMASGGSARDENTARFGMISGGFMKRLVIIGWALCGLLALAVFRGGLADPDNAWGALSTSLLVPGLMGLMLSGMLLGHMPSVGVSSVSVSALATRNLYQPLVKGRSPQHYLRIGQAAIVVVLALGIAFAMIFTGVIQALTMLITFNTFFGAVVFLIFFWRRLVARAIVIGLVIWVVWIGLVPWVPPYSATFRRLPALLLQTPERRIEVSVESTAADVAAGRAVKPGQPIRKSHVVLPAAVFFDRVARIDPNNPQSPLEGIGRFNVEAFSLWLLGVPVRNFSPAGLLATRWLFDGLFPFVMLIGLSLVFRPGPADLADRFFAKMKTPVAPTPEEDEQTVALSRAQPHRFDHLKLFPGSNWEFMKWTRLDYVGFFGCWVVVGAILLLLLTLLRAGAG